MLQIVQESDHEPCAMRNSVRGGPQSGLTLLHTSSGETAFSETFKELALVQVRRRVRQIDYVTVKGSQQPMGLFTYDVSLERVPSPNQGNYIAYTAAALTRRDSLMSQVSGVGSAADGRVGNAAELLDDDVISFSMSAYNWEYSDHPDLACTWAVDEAFLGLFAQVSLTTRQRCHWKAHQDFPFGFF